MSTAEVVQDAAARVDKGKVGLAKRLSELEIAQANTEAAKQRASIEMRTARQIAEITLRRSQTEIEATEALAQVVKIKGKTDALLARRDADAVRRQVRSLLTQ